MPFATRMSDLVRRLQLLERDAKSVLKLTLPQAHALHALRSSGQLRMQELARCLGLAQSTVTRLVAPLKRMGLLDRRPDVRDGRATCAFLTADGAVMADRIDGVDGDLYEDILSRLPESRRAEVIAAIALLHETVADLGEDAGL
jgi:DNA-binding MarR family transcriptional regulator